MKRGMKEAALLRVLEWETPASAIIFCRTRNEVEELTHVLMRGGYEPAALHGGLTQEQRDAVLRWLPGVPEEFVTLAFEHTLEGTYGAPEYGGNRGRASWAWTRWPGDHQPNAYTRAEISEPDLE